MKLSTAIFRLRQHRRWLDESGLACINAGKVTKGHERRMDAEAIAAVLDALAAKSLEPIFSETRDEA